MLRRVAQRLLSTRGAKLVSGATSAVSVIEKPLSNHAFKPNLIDTINGIAADERRFSVTNYETRVRVNHFLHAVFKNDLSTARQLLQSFKIKCKVNRNRTSFPRNVQLYISCLSTFVAYLVSSVAGSDKDLSEIKRAKDEISGIPGYMESQVSESQLTHMKAQLIVALVKHHHAARNDLHSQEKAKLAAIRLAMEFNVPLSLLIRLVKTQDADILPSLGVIFPDTGLARVEVPTPINVSPYLNDNGTMSLTGLCEMIKGTRFDFKSDKRPMFEIYDELEEDDKSSFIEQYYRHNRGREIEIERHCQNLQESFSSKNIKSSMFKIKETHSKWLTKWNSDICKSLAEVNEESNKRLSKFSFCFELYPAEKLASLLLTRMISLTLIEGHVNTLKLVKSLAAGFRASVYGDVSLRPLYGQLSHYLNEIDSIECFGELVKLVIDSCFLPDELANEYGALSGGPNIPLFEFRHTPASPDKSPFLKPGSVVINDGILDVFGSYATTFFSDSYLLPMLHPPAQWVSPTRGGYLENLTPVIRSPDLRIALEFMNRAHSASQLSSFYSSLNNLGTLPWAVNPQMLKVLDEAFKLEDGILQIPPPISKLKLQRCSPTSYEKMRFSSGEMRRQSSKMAQGRKDVAKFRGIRYNYDLMKKVIDAFGRNGDIVFLPHSADFRGRVYPTTPFISHHNGDVVRSVLMFWEAKPLGPNGYNWIKYQLANLYCKTKLSMKQALAFVDENMQHILDSATRPLEGERWWAQGDYPWQSLALCQEIKRIEDSGIPLASIKSRIPIHQDGTCNGLQHYAALGADKTGARSVNLLPSEERQDVYLKVLDKVRLKAQADSESTDEQTRRFAKECLRHASRKLIKQTVMTTVYGVTRFGAREQIRGKLAEVMRETPSESAPDDSYVLKLADYIAKIVLESITELFAGAKTIQDWLLRNCMRYISAFEAEDLKSREKLDFFSSKVYRPMMWTSMMGFPVVQLYKHDKKKEIVTSLQKVTVHEKYKVSHLNIRKQLNALAPNFIHSLDAIHLQMTCLAAKSAGISFAAVHDSFWTHPSDVGTLNRVIREEFVRLHESQIIKAFKEDLEYNNRSAWQVVWVNTLENEDFASAISDLRSQYSLEEGPNRGKSYFNKCLAQELRNPTDTQALVQKYGPRQWFQNKGTSKVAVRYDKDTGESIMLSPKTFVPILVPVKVLDEPPVGTLNIASVLESEFFFS